MKLKLLDNAVKTVLVDDSATIGRILESVYQSMQMDEPMCFEYAIKTEQSSESTRIRP